MWHFLNFKKQALDMESILCWYKATHWLGMWQLWYQYTLRIYITDYWKPYTEIIPKELLLQNKKYTHSIERNNSCQRHWFVWFRRKICVVSRSLEMVDLTMALFAKFHCNSSFSYIYLNILWFISYKVSDILLVLLLYIVEIFV